MNIEPNPWLEIPAADYEGHMGSPEVGQLQMLNLRMREVLAETRPRSVAVLGCTTGNGFEHFDLAITQSILGVDINPDYLRQARERYSGLGSALELVCTDLNRWNCGKRRFDLVHAALIFEYVHAERLLGQIYAALKPGGILSVVLQLPVEGLPAVSQARFSSLEKLSPLFHHDTPEEFDGLASRQGLDKTASRIETLASRKTFLFTCYQRRLEAV
jgi:SAM-dependent methyltransferase